VGGGCGFQTGVRDGQRQEQKSKRAKDRASPGWAGSRWRAAHRDGSAPRPRGRSSLTRGQFVVARAKEFSCNFRDGEQSSPRN